MNFSRFLAHCLFVSIVFVLPACSVSREEPAIQAVKVTATTVKTQDASLTRQYVCQLQAHRRLDVRAPVKGVITSANLRSGQVVKRDSLLFEIEPVSDRLDPNASLTAGSIKVTAPFDGVIDSLSQYRSSLVQEGDSLARLSDSGMICAYFNLPEARYFQYVADQKDLQEEPKYELVLADGSKFDHLGKLATIEAEFNPQTGTIPFRADFPNPDGLLRHGQTGTIIATRIKRQAIVVPQRATIELDSKRYIYLVDNDDVVHKREIMVQHEFEDSFVVSTGLAAGDRIAVDGIRQLHDGDKVRYPKDSPQNAAVILQVHQKSIK